MVGNMIGFVSCLLCAVPFFLFSIFGKNSDEPMNFWSGDTTLKSKVKNVKEYNREMAALYKKYAAAFLAAGAGCLILPVFGMILLFLDGTAGVYILYRNYKRILGRYS